MKQKIIQLIESKIFQRKKNKKEIKLPSKQSMYSLLNTPSKEAYKKDEKSNILNDDTNKDCTCKKD
jgi:hypothetical protein